MLAYVGAKVDAIIVDSIDGDAIITAVKAANKAGIPVDRGAVERERRQDRDLHLRP